MQPLKDLIKKATTPVRSLRASPRSKTTVIPGKTYIPYLPTELAQSNQAIKQYTPRLLHSPPKTKITHKRLQSTPIRNIQMSARRTPPQIYARPITPALTSVSQRLETPVKKDIPRVRDRKNSPLKSIYVQSPPQKKLQLIQHLESHSQNVVLNERTSPYPMPALFKREKQRHQSFTVWQFSAAGSGSKPPLPLPQPHLAQQPPIP